MIKIRYSAIDGVNKRKSFKTLAGARKYAQEMIGVYPSFGSYYAVSDDGVGKIEVIEGVKLRELFGNYPEELKSGEPPSGEFKIYIVHPLGKYFTSRDEALAEVDACKAYDPEGAYGPYEIQEETATKEDFS